MFALARYRHAGPRPDGAVARRCVQAAVLLYPICLYFVTGPALLAGLVLLSLYARRFFLEEKQDVGTGAHGSATLAARSDLEAAGMLRNDGGLPVGRVAPLPPPLWRSLIDLFRAPREESKEVTSRFLAAILSRRYGNPPVVYLNRFFNVAVIAPPGAGKGAAIIVPALLTCPKSMVVLDPKGENFTLTARHRATALGHRVRRLDPFNVCGAGADTLNLLSILDPASPTVVDDCLALADALVLRTGQEHDPHWSESAVNAITAFILYVIIYAPPATRTLTTVAELITDPKEFRHAVESMQDRQGAFAARFGRTHAYESLRRYGNQLSALVDKELSSVQSTIGRHLAWTNSPLVQASLGSSSFDLAELARARTTLYLVMPPDKLESHSRLLRLWITACSRALVRNGLQERNEVVLLLDEIGNAGQLKVLREGITMLRGYGARYVFVLQSVGQFKELFGEAADTVKAGFDCTVFFGIRDHATAKEMSERIGQTTVRNASSSESYGTSGPGFSIFSGGQGGQTTASTTTTTSTTEVGRALVMPDELTRESERTVFVLQSGRRPMRVEQARYYEDPAMSAAVAGRSEPAEAAHPELPPWAPATSTSESPADEAGSVDWAAVTGPRCPTTPSPQTRPAEERIRFACRCGKRFSLAPAMAGKRAKCTNPNCRRVFVIPHRGTRAQTRTS